MTLWTVCIIGAYLVGSIPFGVIIGLAHGVDIRRQGSRNIGATNVGRVLGRTWGMVCFGLDFLKGAAPVLIAGIVNGAIGHDAAELPAVQMWLWLAVAGAAVLGHMFSVFIGFRGGKGVATAFGTLAAMWPLLTFPAFGALVVWYVTLRLTRYISVASMLASASIPIWYLTTIPGGSDDLMTDVLHGSPPFIVTAALAGLVIIKHRANIGRLRRGEEPRVGGSARRGDVLTQNSQEPE
jgi:glycerol-3-phosphate acyltransferase PlsY